MRCRCSGLHGRAPWATATRAPRSSETAPAALALGALGAAVYGPHVARGGFYADDWWNDDLASRGVGFAVRRQFEVLGSKPLLAPLLVLPHAILGARPALHLALALVLAVLASTCFFAVLREAGVDAPLAGTAAALALLFPWSDAGRLWATGGVDYVAVCLYLAGLLLALRGLRAGGRRGLVLRVAAATLYAASVLTYEIAAAAAGASVLVYAARAGLRRALAAWPLDLCAVGAAVAYSLATTNDYVAPLSAQIRQVLALAHGALLLLLDAALPAPAPRAVAAVVLAAAVVVAGILAARGRTELRRPLALAAAGCVAVAAGYASFVADPYWVPQRSGLENRVNLLAAFGFALVLVALAELAARMLRRPLAAVALVALLAAGYVVHVERDARLYDRAAARQEETLRTIARAGRLPHGSTVYAVGSPAELATWVPIFSEGYDLDPAVRIRSGDPTLHGYPVFAHSRLRCTAAGVRAVSLAGRNGPLATALASGYGRTFFSDVRSGRTLTVDSRASCLRTILRLDVEAFRPARKA